MISRARGEIVERLFNSSSIRVRCRGSGSQTLCRVQTRRVSRSAPRPGGARLRVLSLILTRQLHALARPSRFDECPPHFVQLKNAWKRRDVRLRVKRARGKFLERAACILGRDERHEQAEERRAGECGGAALHSSRTNSSTNSPPASEFN